MIQKNFNYDINDLFREVFGGTDNIWKSAVVTKTNEPETESYEINSTKDGAYLFFEAPGFNKTNLKADMEDGMLIIEGKRTYKLRGEEVEKSISKRFKIGRQYDASLIEATIEDGILTVFVPNFKTPEKKRINLL